MKILQLVTRSTIINIIEWAKKTILQLIKPEKIRTSALGSYNNKSADPEWHRKVVGGMWEVIGKLQFNFMLEQGLLPDHYFLDVGCGSLRGGVHFIGYLEHSHYFGVDINQDLLESGRGELRKENLLHKDSFLFQTSIFDFTSLNQKFEYALAQSVFTHLPLNNIIRCIINIEKVLVQGGQFYATFFENLFGKFKLEPVFHSGADSKKFPTFLDKDPYHYSVDTFKWICEGTGLEVSYIGDFSHPRDQKMLLFTKV